MRVRLFGRSDVGRRRSSNEDSFVLCEDEGLGVVCDGMGGHEFGEIASRMAVDLMAERVADVYPRLVESGRKLSQTRAMAQELVAEWTEEINGAIHDRALEAADDEGSARSKMGTTLALVFVVTDFAVVAHVGDSRVYRMRSGVLERMTEDHTVVADAKRHPADPRPPRKRKYVTRALGTKPTVEPDVRLVEVFAGDVFVLCSDGLTDLVEDEEIAEVLRKAKPDWRKAVRSLIHLANKRGGVDNVTVVLVEVLGESDDDDDTEALPLMR